MLASRAKPGVNREQLVERLARELSPETWDLIRRGELSHVLYMVGDEPGFFAVLHAKSIEDARAIVERGLERIKVFDVDIIPVKQFPHFD
jgi:hypothetical protein